MPASIVTADIVRKHVLVADDYPDTAASLAEVVRMATPMFVSVAIALNGVDAVALAIAQPPRLAILDIDMPSLDGYEAGQRIRDSSTASAPVTLVAVTGRTDRGVDLGAVFDHVMGKPVDIDRLIHLLEEA